MEFRTAHRLALAAEAPRSQHAPPPLVRRAAARAAGRSGAAALASFAACVAGGTRHPVGTFDLLATPRCGGRRAWR